MGCDDVKRVIYFYLDGSLGESKLRDLLKHLGLCHDCESRIRIQKRLREFVHRRLAPESASERFKVRLTRSLRAVRVDI